jgi:hypothetical protein
MRFRQLSMLLLAALVACRIFDGDSGPRFIEGRFRQVVTPASVNAPQDAAMRFFASGHLRWRRTYAGQPDHVITGKYEFHAESLRVSWAHDVWYTLGAHVRDTLRLSYQGPGDWPIREFYIRD